MSRRVPLKESEKRSRILDLMWEKKCVFNLKELESQCDKEKGITPQSVKDLVGVLVADNLIDSDKIGSGLFFWSLPSKVEKAKSAQRDKLKIEIAILQNELSATQAQIKAARIARQPTKERKMKLEQVNQLRAKRKAVDTDLEKFAACDPDKIKKIKTGITVCKDAANRWTDNIEMLIGYYKNRAGGDLDTATRNGLLEYLGLPKDLDNLE